MNLIEPKSTSKVIKKFFFKNLLLVSNHLRETGKSYFPTKPDLRLETYFAKRKKTTMLPEDFKIPACDSVDNFREALFEFWKSQGNIELCDLTEKLSVLAKLLYTVEDQNEEVSPFIYVMF